MKRRIGLLITPVLFFIGCAENILPEQQEDAIVLAGKVEGSSSGVPVSIGADYTVALPVAFARVDCDRTYADVNTALPATRVGGSAVSEIRFTEPQYYQPVNSARSETRLVGWFPAVTPVSGLLSFDISEGTTDVMLTQELTGTAERKFCTGKKPFVFSHRLCQIVVSVTAASEETVRRWGSLTSVKLKNTPTNYIVALPSTASVSGTTDVVLNRRGSTSKMPPVALSAGRYVECGYVLTLPSTNSLTVELSGSSGEHRLIEAPLPAGEVFREGYIYHLRLNLDGIQSVPATLTTAGWGEEVNLDIEF